MKINSKRISALLAAAALAFGGAGVFTETQVGACPQGPLKAAVVQPKGDKKAEKAAEKELKKEEKIKPAKPGKEDKGPDKDKNKPGKEDKGPHKDINKPGKGPGHEDNKPVEPDVEVIPGDEVFEHPDASLLWMSKIDYETMEFRCLCEDQDLFSLTFKVSEDTADGVYVINYTDSTPDMVDKTGEKQLEDVTAIPGYVIVGDSNDVPEYESDEDGTAIVGSKAYVNAGDYATVYFSIKNNPGIAAYCYKFDFDTSVLEFCSADSLAASEITEDFVYTGFSD